MAKDTIKLIQPKDDDDVQLPELAKWETVAGRPTSLNDLDPDAQQELNDVEATFLTLGDLAYLDQITETEITDNSISTPKLQAGSVQASKMSVGQLSAISADLGSITAGTITGATIRTSSSGQRIEMENDVIESYDSGGDLRFKIDSDKIFFYDDNEDEKGYIIGGTDSMNINVNSGDTVELTVSQQGVMSLGGSVIRAYEQFEVRDQLVVDDGIFVLYGGVEVDGDIIIEDGNFEITDDGFFNLARMTGSTADSTPGDQDGSMYYRTTDDVIRVKINGSWETVQTV